MRLPRSGATPQDYAPFLLRSKTIPQPIARFFGRRQHPLARPGQRPQRASCLPRQGIRPDLDRLDDRELLDIVRSQPRSGEQRAVARDLLVSRYRPLVRSCVSQYSRGPEPAEDLMQVGMSAC